MDFVEPLVSGFGLRSVLIFGVDVHSPKVRLNIENNGSYSFYRMGEDLLLCWKTGLVFKQSNFSRQLCHNF